MVGPEADGEEIPPPANAGFALEGRRIPPWVNPPAPPLPLGGHPVVPPPPPYVFTDWELHRIRGSALDRFYDTLSLADQHRWQDLQRH